MLCASTSVHLYFYTQEWTAAVLFSLIPSEVIIKILSMLLLEKSLLVCSADLALATAISTAFALLLRPFAWEGIFVPLLPFAAYEVLDAPVPYIIGEWVTLLLLLLFSIVDSYIC